MSDKTKAAPHGRQCSTTKQIQHTRTCAGGQRMSQRNFAPTDFIQFCTLGTAALAQLGCTALQHTTQKSRSCEHYPVSGNQPYMIGGVLPGSSGVAKMQLGQLPYNFRHWQGYAAVPYTLKEISPNLGRLISTTSPKQRGCAALQCTLDLAVACHHLLAVQILSMTFVKKLPEFFYALVEPLRIMVADAWKHGEVTPCHAVFVIKNPGSNCNRIGLDKLDSETRKCRANPFHGYFFVEFHFSTSEVVVLIFLRCRRLISPRIEVTINPALLSPSSLRDSISATTSCGTRTVNSCDFAFLLDVAITDSFDVWCVSVYAKKSYVQCLKCVSLKCSFESEGETHLVSAKPGSARNTNRASDHNVIGANNMAELQHTQTRPKYQDRFLALSAIGCNVIHIIATTEREAREQSPAGCVMVFAGRLPVREVTYG